MTSPFPSPWFSNFLPSDTETPHDPITKIEWAIIDFSSMIREKPNWQQKYKDKTIADKWIQEFKNAHKSSDPSDIVTPSLDEICKYTFEELKLFETLPSKFDGFEQAGFNIAFDEKICSSDTAISETTRNELIKWSTDLYNLFEELDYHPGSNNQVVDLVHPSLFPLVYGKTAVRINGKLQISKYGNEIKFKKDTECFTETGDYQWLPTLFKRQGSKFIINSYINNLHPKHKELYDIIEEVFNHAVLGLNYTLSRFGSPHFLRVKYPFYEDLYNKEYFKVYDELWDKRGPDAFDVLEKEKYKYVKKLDVKYQEPPLTMIDLKEFDNLKVIVKMANIELTPENPKYAGGSWHIEGCINEDIVATVLYYYDMDNITTSKLSFRASFNEPLYEQDDTFYPDYLFGFKDEDVLVRNLGSIEAKQNRIVIFPNGHQHHVDPFELADKSKNGHRKILCFFLVDPYNPVVKTTAQVPPQQPDNEWSALVSSEDVEELLDLGNNWPISWEEAKEIRELLMKERSIEYEDDPFTRQFSLCEH